MGIVVSEYNVHPDVKAYGGGKVRINGEYELDPRHDGHRWIRIGNNEGDKDTSQSTGSIERFGNGPFTYKFIIKWNDPKDGENHCLTAELDSNFTLTQRSRADVVKIIED